MKRYLFAILLTSSIFTLEAKTTDLSKKGTANCYIVKPGAAAEYKFRADIKGNGVATLGHSAEIDMMAAKSVKVIWEDADIVDDSSLKLADKEIVFRTNAKMENGNALIGIFSDNGCIWSWHIWMTEATDYKVAEYTFLDRNLGAYSTELGPNGENGCFWQWGRKDPFPADFSLGITTCEAPKDYEYANANPSVFITSGGSWMGWNAYDAWIKDGQKTMYDPCPAGYQVPNNSDIIKIKALGLRGNFPKSGAIWYDLDPSGLRMTGKAGFYWTSTITPGMINRSDDFYIWENGIGLGSHYFNSSAMSIRPQKTSSQSY